MSNNNLLPLGTVVYLNEGTVPLMIVLRRPVLNIDDKSIYFDYAAINQIIGLEPDKISYFNHENIDKIIFEGYAGKYEERLQEGYINWLEEHPEVEKGDVDKLNGLLWF